MNDANENARNDRLLHAQLGQLSESEQIDLEASLRNDPDLQARNRRLQKVLQPLEAWTAPAPPPNLVDRILRAATTSDLPVVAESDLPTGADNVGGRMRFSMRDLIAVAAVLTFFFGILAPSMATVRERSRRVACANNLGAIGRGVSAYALSNNGALPRSPLTHRSSFLPVRSGAGEPYAPNSRHMLLLVRFKFVGDPRAFICPSRSGPNLRVVLSRRSGANSAEVRYVSYNALNMAGPTPKVATTSSLPYIADANPLFTDGKFNGINPRAANSPNHPGATGQNILCMDGSAHWSKTPNCGHARDNIWQAGQITQYTGTEIQESERDTFLVP